MSKRSTMMGDSPSYDKDTVRAKKKRAQSLYRLGLGDDEAEIGEFNEDAVKDAAFSVQIMGTDLYKVKGEKSYTVYKVEVTLDIDSWLIYRRYSQFYFLFKELKANHNLGSHITQKFPPKQLIQNLSPQVIDKRHQMLQDWIKAVLEDPVLKVTEPVMLFVAQGREDINFVPRVRNTTIESDIDMAGQLHKPRNGKWISRWYVLRHGLMYKYETAKAKHPNNFYDLRGATARIVTGDELTKLKAKSFPYILSADGVTGPETQIYFAADSEEVLQKWVNIINKNDAGKPKGIFGTSIDQVRDRDSNGVPLFLSALLTFLEATALEVEDLFTKPPDEEIKRQIDRGKLLDVYAVVDDVHAVAGLIVQYLNELPEPIIPEDVHDLFYGIFQLKNPEFHSKFIHHFSEILPVINRNMLIKLFSFLNAASNNYKIERLTKLFGRLILRPRYELENSVIHDIMVSMITNWEYLIVEGEVYMPPEKILVVKKRKSSKRSKKAKVNTESTSVETTEEPPSDKKDKKRKKKHSRDTSRIATTEEDVEAEAILHEHVADVPDDEFDLKSQAESQTEGEEPKTPSRPKTGPSSKLTNHDLKPQPEPEPEPEPAEEDDTSKTPERPKTGPSNKLTNKIKSDDETKEKPQDDTKEEPEKSETNFEKQKTSTEEPKPELATPEPKPATPEPKAVTPEPIIDLPAEASDESSEESDSSELVVSEGEDYIVMEAESDEESAEEPPPVPSTRPPSKPAPVPEALLPTTPESRPLQTLTTARPRPSRNVRGTRVITDVGSYEYTEPEPKATPKANVNPHQELIASLHKVLSQGGPKKTGFKKM